MKALVVYESMYGNTARIGEAIASGLRAGGIDVDVGPVSEFEPDDTAAVDLLVVGGPTHVHGMSTARSRGEAVKDETNTYAHATVEPGLREWVQALPACTHLQAAAFDTRIDKPAVLTGSAAKGIAHRLEGRGLQQVAKPHSFFVSTKNRLLEGEVEQAEVWGREVAEKAFEAPV